MKLRGAFIGAVVFLSLGCGGNRRAPSAPRPHAPPTRPLLRTELATFGEVLEATSAEAKPRLVTYAGLLELLLHFEGASSDLDTRLAHLKPEEKGLRSSLAAARASLGRA